MVKQQNIFHGCEPGTVFIDIVIAMQQKDKILDELLIMQMREGDLKAASLFVKRWHTRLIWYSYQVIQDKDEAQDIVQDNWNGILNGLQQLKEIKTYKTWIYRVIRNRTVDRLRKLQRDQEKLKAMEADDVAVEGEHKEANITIVKKLLQQLPSGLKEILHLFYLQEYAIDEISEILNIPQGTVKSRLYRAREQMKTLVKDAEHLFEF